MPQFLIFCYCFLFCFDGEKNNNKKASSVCFYFFFFFFFFKLISWISFFNKILFVFCWFLSYSQHFHLITSKHQQQSFFFLNHSDWFFWYIVRNTLLIFIELYNYLFILSCICLNLTTYRHTSFDHNVQIILSLGCKSLLFIYCS